MRESFKITVGQGYAKPVLGAVATQTLREGDAFKLQLAGSVPGGLTQADGATITLDYFTPWLPGGASLNSETGWFEWTPGYRRSAWIAIAAKTSWCNWWTMQIYILRKSSRLPSPRS